MSICKNKKNQKCKPAFPVPLPSSFLQQLRKQSQEQLSQPQSRTPAGLILLRHFPALFQCLLHIPPDIQHRITIRHKTSIFKMMIKAPVIQIDRAASRHAVIRHAHLGMTEPRCPLIDPYTILYQIVIERPGDTVDQFLIRKSTPRLAASERACVISSVMIRYGVMNQQYLSALLTILI